MPSIPTETEVQAKLNLVRIYAEEVMDGMHPFDGGDEFNYNGSMGAVENLREAVKDYHWLHDLRAYAVHGVIKP